MANLHVDLYNGNDANDGSSWETAWKTGLNKSALISAGDLIKVSKTPSPISIGNALWTDKSKTVVLATPQTKTIDNCDVVWTNVHALQPTAYTSGRKEGTASLRLRCGTLAGRTVGGIIVYKTLATPLDLSQFQEISFYLGSNYAMPNDTLRIRLCSDTMGAVAVNEFQIPEILAGEFQLGRFIPFTLPAGGNLGNNINSIALVYGVNFALSTLGNNYLMFDNFMATKTNGLNLNTLISKNGSSFTGNEPYFAIQSINEATVLLDNSPACLPTQGLGYSGTTETVETFIRIPFNARNNIFSIDKAGSLGNYIVWEGGYNTATDLVDGETYLDGAIGNSPGILINHFAYNQMKGFSVFRYNVGVQIGTASSTQTALWLLLNIGEANNNHTSGIVWKGRVGNIIVKHINNNGQTVAQIAFNGDGWIDAMFIDSIYSLSNNYYPFKAVGSYVNVIGMGEIKNISNIKNNNNQPFYIEATKTNVDNINIYDGTILTLVRVYGSIFQNIQFNATGPGLMSIDRCTYCVFKNISGTANLLSSSNGIVIFDSFDVLFDNINITIGETFVYLCVGNAEVTVKNTPNFRKGSYNNNYKSIIKLITVDNQHFYYHFNDAQLRKVTDPTHLPPDVEGNFFETTSTNPNPVVMYPVVEFAYEANKQVNINIWTALTTYGIYGEFVLLKDELNGIANELTFSITPGINTFSDFYQLAITFTPTLAGVATLYQRGQSNIASGPSQTSVGWMFYGPMEITQAN